MDFEADDDVVHDFEASFEDDFDGDCDDDFDDVAFAWRFCGHLLRAV